MIKASSLCFKRSVEIPRGKEVKEIMTRMGTVIDNCRCSAEVASPGNLFQRRKGTANAFCVHEVTSLLQTCDYDDYNNSFFRWFESCDGLCES